MSIKLLTIGKLHCHYIDYDKKNNDPTNLISSCHKCHSKTTVGNHKYWQTHYENIQIKRQVHTFEKYVT